MISLPETSLRHWNEQLISVSLGWCGGRGLCAQGRGRLPGCTHSSQVWRGQRESIHLRRVTLRDPESIRGRGCSDYGTPSGPRRYSGR